MIYLQDDLAKEYKITDTAIALGKFDGIHIGHQLLIEGLLREKTENRKALVFTFGDSPGTVLKGDSRRVIYTGKEKAHYFEELGVDILLEYPFTKAFAACPPEKFVEEYLVRQLGVKSIFVGEDFCFGKNRSGNVALLNKMSQDYGYTLHAVPKKSCRGEIVSSTRIREELETNFSVANILLGNPYFVYGQVIHGKHLGHKIGFPTMNQSIESDKIIPRSGVYASRVWIQDTPYAAISNLGQKPTVGGENETGLETHILNFNEDLYGEYVKTELLSYIRPERKFADIDQLKLQIEKDIHTVEKRG